MVFYAKDRIVTTSDVQGGDNLFTMDVSSGAQSLAGFDSIRDAAELGVSINRTYEASGGPSGQGAYRWDYIHDPAQQDAPNAWGGQFYYGWQVDTGSAPAQGSVRYVRWRMKFSASTNFRSVSWDDGSTPSAFQNKLIIHADGEASSRTIISYLSQDDQATWDLIIGKGGGNEVLHTGLAKNTWYNMQVRIQSGSSAPATDAIYALWVNNNVFASPTESATGFALETTGGDQWGVGYFSNHNISATGIVSWTITNVEIGPTFRTDWN